MPPGLHGATASISIGDDCGDPHPFEAPSGLLSQPLRLPKQAKANDVCLSSGSLSVGMASVPSTSSQKKHHHKRRSSAGDKEEDPEEVITAEPDASPVKPTKFTTQVSSVHKELVAASDKLHHLSLWLAEVVESTVPSSGAGGSDRALKTEDPQATLDALRKENEELHRQLANKSQDNDKAAGKDSEADKKAEDKDDEMSKDKVGKVHEEVRLHEAGARLPELPKEPQEPKEAIPMLQFSEPDAVKPAPGVLLQPAAAFALPGVPYIGGEKDCPTVEPPPADATEEPGRLLKPSAGERIRAIHRELVERKRNAMHLEATERTNRLTVRTTVRVAPPAGDDDKSNNAETGSNSNGAASPRLDKEIKDDEWAQAAKLLKSKDEGAYGGIKRVFRGSRTVFADPEQLKEQARILMCKHQYRASDYYSETGIWPTIARSPHFDHITLCMIVLNAIWLAVDTDYNDAALLIDAHPTFIVVESIFSVFFTVEIIVRFMAFSSSRYAFRDNAFLFDAVLVAINFLETVVFSVILFLTDTSTDGFQSASLLRLFRLIRLARMARVVRLLRAMPELMILCRGILVASRAVFFTLCLLVLIVYIFAVAFKQLTSDLEIGKKRFNTVLDAMNFLLLTSMVPDLLDYVEELGQSRFLFGALYMFFILLASLTVINMLVGVLVEVVGIVSKVEREELLVMNVKYKLSHVLNFHDSDANRMISRFEFETLVVNPDAVQVIQELGVDVVGLVDYIDFIFQEHEELTFSSFMELVLQLRGSNAATVKDIVDLRKFLHETMTSFEKRMVERLPTYGPKEQDFRPTELHPFPLTSGQRNSEETRASGPRDLGVAKAAGTGFLTFSSSVRDRPKALKMLT